jgi:hypothetical protein
LGKSVYGSPTLLGKPRDSASRPLSLSTNDGREFANRHGVPVSRGVDGSVAEHHPEFASSADPVLGPTPDLPAARPISKLAARNVCWSGLDRSAQGLC